jgi:hypothetical protein
MSTTYRFSDSSVPARSSPTFADQVVRPHASYSSFSAAQQQSAAIYISSNTSPQSPSIIAHAPAVGQKRKRLAHGGEYVGSNLHPRKKRKMDNSVNIDTREHIFTTVPAIDHEMADAVEAVKQQEPLTPSTSPPHHSDAVLLAGQRARSALLPTKSANLPAVSPLTPPPTPPFQPGSNRTALALKEAPPSNDHDQSKEVTKSHPKAAVPITTPPESLFVGAPVSCSHALHPAYSGSYESLLCPRCRTGSALSELQAIQRAIEDKGGVHHWFETNRKLKEWRAYLNGGDEKHKKYAFKDREDRDISLRHCKKRLMELKLKLEGYAKQEAAWEEVEVRKYRNFSPDQVDRFVFSEFLGHSARYTLKKINHLEVDGNLSLTEDHNCIAKHESALELRRSLDLEDGGKASNDNPSALPANSPRRLLIGETDVYNTNIIPPANRMHRRPRCKVSFDQEAKVYVENDIDTLCKNSTHAIAGRDLPSIAGTESNMDGTSKPRFETIALHVEDRMGRDKLQYARHNLQYSPGSWAQSPNSIIIDTSGTRCKSSENWERYNRQLEIEADHWDAQDAVDAAQHAQSLPVDQEDFILRGEDGFSFSGLFRDSFSWLSSQMPHAVSPTTPGVAYISKGYYH